MTQTTNLAWMRRCVRVRQVREALHRILPHRTTVSGFRLRRKDHIGWVDFDEREATSPGFLEEIADVCRRAVPYMKFLTTAVGLRF